MEQPSAARSVGLTEWWPQLSLSADSHLVDLLSSCCASTRQQVRLAAGQLLKELEQAGACKAPSLLGLAL